LQLRTMSKVGTRSATVTTSCELKAIIEIEIGMLVSPFVSGSIQAFFDSTLTSARNIDCSIDSGKQCAFLQGLQKKSHQATILLMQASVVVSRYHDRRDIEVIPYQMLLQLLPAHDRHLKIDNQAFGKAIGQ
jgi:hypothetical protein